MPILCQVFSTSEKITFESEKDQLLPCASQHIATVRDYRLTPMRYANLSEEPDSGIMKIDVDFCDQANSGCRGTQHPAKQQNHCGDRSCTKLVSLLSILGREALEAYYIDECDQPKDASNEISLLARALDHCK